MAAKHIQKTKRGEGTSAPNEAERRLLESALTLFSERGFAATTIREIIERAQVTRPVLYYYFENKEQLFVRLIEAWFTQIGDGMDCVLSKKQSLRECLRDLALNAFRMADSNPAAVRLTLQAFFAPQVEGLPIDLRALWEKRFGRIVARMQEGLDEGTLAGADAETLARTFLSMIDMHILTKTHWPELALSPELAETIVRIFLCGASGPAKAKRPGKAINP